MWPIYFVQLALLQVLPPSRHRKKLTRKNIEDLRNYMKQRRGEEDKQAVRVVRIRVQIEPDADPAMVLILDGSSGNVARTCGLNQTNFSLNIKSDNNPKKHFQILPKFPCSSVKCKGKLGLSDKKKSILWLLSI